MRSAVDGRAAAIMVGFCFIMGMQQVAIKAVLDEVAPVLQIAIRSGIAAGLVWLCARLFVRERWVPGVGMRSGLLVGGLFALEYLLMGEGLRWTSAAHMAVFLYTAPLFAAVGLHLRLPEERLTPLQWLGIALAFAGIVVTFIVPSQGGAAASSSWLWGDLLGVGAGLAWGLTTVAIRVSRLSEAPPTQTLFYQLWYAAIFLGLYAAWSGQTGFQGTGLAWASLAFQSLVISFAATLTWFWLLRRYLAAPLGVLLFMTPLFGVAMGVVLLGETLTPAFVLGSVFVLAGLLVVNSRAWWPARRAARGRAGRRRA